MMSDWFKVARCSSSLMLMFFTYLLPIFKHPINYWNIILSFCLLFIQYFCNNHFTFFSCNTGSGKLVAYGREISIQGKSALPLVQLSISFSISCLEKYDFYFLLLQQLNLKLIENFTSGSAPSPCIKISLLTAVLKSDSTFSCLIYAIIR